MTALVESDHTMHNKCIKDFLKYNAKDYRFAIFYKHNGKSFFNFYYNRDAMLSSVFSYMGPIALYDDGIISKYHHQQVMTQVKHIDFFKASDLHFYNPN